MPECGRVRRIAFTAAVCVVIAACSAQEVTAPVETVRLIERVRVSMGSELRLTAWTSDERNALATFEHIFEDFDTSIACSASGIRPARCRRSTPPRATPGSRFPAS